MHTELIEKCLMDLVDRYHIPGGVLLVYQHGNPVFSRCFGYSDYEKTRLAALDDYYWLYSLTKLSTATAMMQLLEGGKLNLEDKVADYLPAFNALGVSCCGALRPNARAMTIEHLLTMRGGYSYDLTHIKSVLRPSDGQMAVINALAHEPLTADPGTRFQYGLCHDVLGGVIECVSGLSPQDYFQKYIYQPLGMHKTCFVPTANLCKPFMAQYEYNAAQDAIEQADMSNTYILTPNYSSCGAGLVSTPGDYVLLINALANADALLKKSAIAFMAQNRLTGNDLNTFSAWRPGYGYGLGVRSKLDDGAMPEFGWDGAGGTYALCDPKAELAVLYMQQVLNLPYAYDVIHPTLRDVIYSAM